MNFRLLYHKKDESTAAHLQLGLLAFWLTNTLRDQLKKKGTAITGRR
ncbi:MAG TPA: hypothetical protein PKC30_02660 [Saprospiraceae bacterium]|nr:hypothetical protein [Saprospiraceae bacterium]